MTVILMVQCLSETFKHVQVYSFSHYLYLLSKHLCKQMFHCHCAGGLPKNKSFMVSHGQLKHMHGKLDTKRKIGLWNCQFCSSKGQSHFYCL